MWRSTGPSASRSQLGERFARCRRLRFTALNELEAPNAFELLVGCGLISRAQGRAVQAHLREEVESERLMRLSQDLERLFADACELSRAHSAKRLTRSLDLLHIAAAHQTTCTTFVSADDRQLAVARATGLEIVDIKRRARRRESEP